MMQLKNTYESLSSGELRATFPVNGGQFAILRLAIPDVQAGDVLDIKAYCQASNNISGGPNVGVGSNIKGGAVGAETLSLTRSHVRNVNGQRHHEPIAEFCTYTATENWAEFGVAMFLYGLSTSTSSHVTVDPNYGRIHVSHFRDENAPPPPPPPPPSENGIVLDTALTAAFGNCTGKTLRCRISPDALLLPPGPITQIRLRLNSHAEEPLQLAKLFVSPRGSSAFAMTAATPVPVSGSTSFTIPAGGEVWTDWVPFAWNGMADLVWSTYVSGNATADKVPAISTYDSASTGIKNGDEAGSLNPSGLVEYLGYLSLVSGIETNGF